MNQFSDDNNPNQKRKKEQFKAHLSSKGITIDFLREEIEKYFPNLVNEIENTDDGSYYPIKKTIETPNELNHVDNSNENLKNSINFDEIENSKEEIVKKINQQVSSRYDTDSELFNPKTEDFLRRCKNLKEANEIIMFQLKMGEIDEEKANLLQDICKTQGLEYFGTHKKQGYYEKKYRRIVI